MSKIKAFFAKERVLTENTDLARELYNKSVYGSVMDDGTLQLSLVEALYLLEKGKLEVLDGRKQKIPFEK